ncbi:MAG TPA: pitrilysin family protein, partial [Terriglobia bacterium]|nr:pitrilysin family protein [Terriglobia bacterium]
MRALLLPIALTAILAVPAAARENTPPKPKHLQYREMTLQNGLHVVMHEDHSTPIVNVQVWYHAGSKNEKPGRTGFAHLFEHLMFKGSAHVAPEEHSRIIARAGGVDNAYTNTDVTVYWETVPANYLEKVLWLEADRMQSLNVSEENFRQEREVVKEERLTRYENPPYGDLYETLYENAFHTHPYHHMTIGSMADLNAASIAEVRDFYNLFYTPNNATLVIAGDFHTDDVMSMVKKYFGDIRQDIVRVDRAAPPEPPQTEERRITREKAVPLPAYVAGYHSPRDGDPDYYPLQILSSILSDGRSSRLYQSLIYEKKLAVDAGADALSTEDPNLFVVQVILNRGASLADVEKAVDEELTRLKTAPVTDEELEKAKTGVRAQYTFGRQSVQQKASALGHAAVIHDDLGSVDNEYDLFMKVTKDDIMRVAKKYLRPENRTVLTVTPAAPPQRGANQ